MLIWVRRRAAAAGAGGATDRVNARPENCERAEAHGGAAETNPIEVMAEACSLVEVAVRRASTRHFCVRSPAMRLQPSDAKLHVGTVGFEKTKRTEISHWAAV